jgi:hypothetical protein
MGSEVIAPPFLTSALARWEWSVSRPCRFTLGKIYLSKSIRPRDSSPLPREVQSIYLFYQFCYLLSYTNIRFRDILDIFRYFRDEYVAFNAVN